MDPPPPRNLSLGQLHTTLSPTFLSLAAVTDPAFSSTHQPPPSDQALRCSTCKQAQPLLAYESRSVPGAFTKNCLRCRNHTRSSRQGGTQRAARSVSVASAVTSASNATRLSDVDGTYPQHALPVPPVHAQEPSHQSQRPSHGTTLERCLETWTRKMEVRVHEWLAPLQTQVRSLAAEFERTHRSQSHGHAAPPAVSTSPPRPYSLPNPGEWSLLRLFPWVSSEVADAISLDRLAVGDLAKLRNPASSSVHEETPTTLTVQGIQINIASTSSTGPLQAFLKAIPDITTFCQVWVVYVSLRAAACSNPALGPALNHFLVHVVDLDRSYPWASVVEYVLTVCQKRFGHADALAWAVRDTEAFQDRLSLAPPKQPCATLLKPKSSDTCWRWNNATCSSSNCKYQHVCTTCRGPTLAATSTCDLFNLLAADECLSSLLRLQRSCPPAQPNTTIASPIFSSSELPARRGLLQTRSDAWAALLELYPCRSTVTQILGAIRHGVNIGYRSPLPTAPGGPPLGSPQYLWPRLLAHWHRSQAPLQEAADDPPPLASPGGATEFAEVRLPRSKTDPFGQGVDLVVPRTRSPVCPYAALHVLCTGRPASAPLFGLGNGFTPFSRTRFLTVLRLLLTCLGLPASGYAGHSFQCGAASWASFVGAPDSVIQTLGRWSSECFRRYVDKPPAEKGRLSSSFVFGSPARPGGPTPPSGL
ncbi:uncharacterized protein UDID_17647 [Ustilago sp. UG-2017a]|nr:uncharacterized protein UDID_17647 [Ustilago sp. UG-2017a]